MNISPERRNIASKKVLSNKAEPCINICSEKKYSLENTTNKQVEYTMDKLINRPQKKS
jgi:hypothetical protein